MDIQPRRPAPRSPVPAEERTLTPRARPVVETPPVLWADRYAEVVRTLKGLGHQALVEASEILAAETGVTVAEALGIIERLMAGKEPVRGRNGRGLGATTRTVEVTDIVQRLRPGDEILPVEVEEPARLPGIFKGRRVRRVDISQNGTGVVVTFEGYGDDDGWALRKYDKIKVRRTITVREG